jgi:deazaflavin-dependent oxidoreductase (nitroreductase family)
MAKKLGLPWRIMRAVNRRSIGVGTAKRPGPAVLFLITTGRKSGLPRTTPLQYEEIDGAYYVGSARGREGDWFRNLEKNPAVEVELKGNRFHARAEAVTDPVRIADFLEYRLKHHPVMMRLMLPFQGLSPFAGRTDLERAAAKGLAIVILRKTG